MNNLNYIPNNADVLFVGLNPTPLAVREQALFNNDRSLWNILECAGVISNSGKIPASIMYSLLISGQIDSSFRIGIADLLPHVQEQHAKDVVVSSVYVKTLLHEAVQKKVKRMGLMGEKVITAFKREFPELNFRSVRDAENFMGEIILEGHSIALYSLPFPNNNNVANKHLYYKNLIEN
jgi:hypothetical protein